MDDDVKSGSIRVDKIGGGDVVVKCTVYREIRCSGGMWCGYSNITGHDMCQGCGCDYWAVSMESVEFGTCKGIGS